MSDISLIFSTDPLKLTRDDISSVIAEMRKKRAAFQLGNVKAGSMKPPTEKQKAATALAAKLGDLGGLDL